MQSDNPVGEIKSKSDNNTPQSVDEILEEVSSLRAEVATVNEALNNATDLLDEARVQRDKWMESHHQLGKRYEATLEGAKVAIDERNQARYEVERLRHYTSTACHHGLHESCGKAQHDRGEDGAPHCKWCPEPCRCVCHGEAS